MSRTTYPVQVPRVYERGERGVSAPVYLKAYEVYRHLYGEQRAMVEDGFDEAMRGMVAV